MKKQDILNSVFWKIAKVKPTCMPYRFLQYMKEQDFEKGHPELIVKDVIAYSPVDIRKFIGAWSTHSEDERQIRVALKKVKEKLLKLGLSKEDGPFMTGSYCPTAQSPKIDWVEYWITELNFNKEDANKLYNLAKKAELQLQ